VPSGTPILPHTPPHCQINTPTQPPRADNPCNNPIQCHYLTTFPPDLSKLTACPITSPDAPPKHEPM